MTNKIHEDFEYPVFWEIGDFNLIENNVKMGEANKIMNYVEIRAGTGIGHRNYIDSRVSFSGGGNCRVDHDCTLRYGSIIARDVHLCSSVFIAPHVKFINIPFIDNKTKQTTIVESGVKIGMGSVIGDGVFIPKGTIIGALSFVRKSIIEKGVYGGNPLRKLRS